MASLPFPSMASACFGRIGVGSFGHDDGLVEVVHRRRRAGLPLQARRAPRIGAGVRRIPQREQQVGQRQHVADRQDRCAGRRHHVQDLILRRILVITPRHPQVAQHELGEEGQVEADEHRECRELAQQLGVHPAAHLGPPEVDAPEVRHHGAADHDVVEVGHHEIGVVDVDVDSQGGEHQARQAAQGEQPDEPQGVEHRRVQPDRPLVHGGRPVEDLDRRRAPPPGS